MITLKIDDPESGRTTVLHMKLGQLHKHSTAAVYHNLCSDVIEKRVCPIRLTITDVKFSIDDLIRALMKLKELV